MLISTCVLHCLLGGSNSVGKNSEGKVLCVCYGATADADVSSSESSVMHPVTIAQEHICSVCAQI